MRRLSAGRNGLGVSRLPRSLQKYTKEPTYSRSYVRGFEKCFSEMMKEVGPLVKVLKAVDYACGPGSFDDEQKALVRLKAALECWRKFMESDD